MNPSFFQTVIENGVWTLPHLVVLAVGAGLVGQLRDRNPLAAHMSLAAFALLALSAAAGPFVAAWFVSAGIGVPAADRVRVSTIYAALSALRTLVGLAGWGLLIAGLRKALLGPDPRP